HYFSDPFMPLNTACSEEAAKIQRALEFSIAKSYGRLQHIIEHDQGSYPQLETPTGKGSGVFGGGQLSINGSPSSAKDSRPPFADSHDWLEKMILTGAELAHCHYDAVLQH